MSDFFQIPAWAQARLEAETTPRPLTSAQAEYLAMTKGPQMLVFEPATQVFTAVEVGPHFSELISLPDGTYAAKDGMDSMTLGPITKRPGRPKGSKNAKP